MKVPNMIGMSGIREANPESSQVASAFKYNAVALQNPGDLAACYE